MAKTDSAEELMPYVTAVATPDSKAHWANMGPIWGRQDPGGPHVGPMNFALSDCFQVSQTRRPYRPQTNATMSYTLKVSENVLSLAMGARFRLYITNRKFELE